jgi:hypothetical protein
MIFIAVLYDIYPKKPIFKNTKLPFLPNIYIIDTPFVSVVNTSLM